MSLLLKSGTVKGIKFIKAGNKSRVEIYFLEVKKFSKYIKNETKEMSEWIMLNFRN